MAHSWCQLKLTMKIDHRCPFPTGWLISRVACNKPFFSTGHSNEVGHVEAAAYADSVRFMQAVIWVAS